MMCLITSLIICALLACQAFGLAIRFIIGTTPKWYLYIPIVGLGIILTTFIVVIIRFHNIRFTNISQGGTPLIKKNEKDVSR